MQSEKNSGALLQVCDLQVRFATAAAESPAVAGISFGALEVVHQITFNVEQGEKVALVGESGSGKSATSLAILRLLPSDAQVDGEINFSGRKLLSLEEKEMRAVRGREIAMIFQEPMTALNPAMHVGAQIAEAVRAHHPGLHRSEVRDRVHAAMDEVALPDPVRRANDYPHQFSGGQRQRILIAMALVNRPRLLIADEPTTALDVTVQAQILELLLQLRKRHNLAMLFISHDLAVVSRVTERVAVMHRGKIVETGDSPEIFRVAQHPYTRGLIAAVPTLHTDRTQRLAVQ